MRPAVKVSLVVAGYVVAFLIAFAVVAVYVAATSGPDRQASAGMFAFGDSLLFLAVFGVAAVVDYVAARTAEASSIVHAWSALAVLRILAAPLLTLAFFLSVLFAPNRSSRIALLVATVVEATVFAYVALIWFLPH